MTAGYSDTPLAKKLGIKPGHVIGVFDQPHELPELLGSLPEGARLAEGLGEAPDIILSFQTEHSVLLERLPGIVKAVYPDRAVWIAWPKKASKVQTDLSGDVVRSAILSTELVDVKVCAISEVWSGLKAVWRSELR